MSTLQEAKKHDKKIMLLESKFRNQMSDMQ